MRKHTLKLINRILRKLVPQKYWKIVLIEK